MGKTSDIVSTREHTTKVVTNKLTTKPFSEADNAGTVDELCQV